MGYFSPYLDGEANLLDCCFLSFSANITLSSQLLSQIASFTPSFYLGIVLAISESTPRLPKTEPCSDGTVPSSSSDRPGSAPTAPSAGTRPPAITNGPADRTPGHGNSTDGDPRGIGSRTAGAAGSSVGGDVVVVEARCQSGNDKGVVSNWGNPRISPHAGSQALYPGRRGCQQIL